MQVRTTFMPTPSWISQDMGSSQTFEKNSCVLLFPALTLLSPCCPLLICFVLPWVQFHGLSFPTPTEIPSAESQPWRPWGWSRGRTLPSSDLCDGLGHCCSFQGGVEASLVVLFVAVKLRVLEKVNFCKLFLRRIQYLCWRSRCCWINRSCRVTVSLSRDLHLSSVFC